MKKLLFSLLLICASTFAKAQTYTFSQSTGTYTDLQAPFILSKPGWGFMDSYNMLITFPFVFAGQTESITGIGSKGLAGFQFGATGISALATDLEDREISTSPSTIGYQLTGNPGSQILKIEWKNAGFIDGTSSDFINFQLWLYEGSNKIEMHYGPSAIASPGSIFFPHQGPAVGLTVATNLSNFTISGVYLQGNPASATAATLNNTNSYPQLSASPANGTIYTFTPATTTTGISEIRKQRVVEIYPNPGNGLLNIKNLQAKGSTTINVYDLAGKIITTQKSASQTSTQLHMENLKPGTYLLEILSAEGRQTMPFLKQ